MLNGPIRRNCVSRHRVPARSNKHSDLRIDELYLYVQVKINQELDQNISFQSSIFQNKKRQWNYREEEDFVDERKCCFLFVCADSIYMWNRSRKRRKRRKGNWGRWQVPLFCCVTRIMMKKWHNSHDESNTTSTILQKSHTHTHQKKKIEIWTFICFNLLMESIDFCFIFTQYTSSLLLHAISVFSSSSFFFLILEICWQTLGRVECWEKKRVHKVFFPSCLLFSFAQVQEWDQYWPIFGSKGVEVPAWLERNTHNIYHLLLRLFSTLQSCWSESFGGGDFEKRSFFSPFCTSC